MKRLVSILTLLCIAFTVNAGVAYSLNSAGNSIVVSVTSDIDFTSTPLPTSSWTTGSFTLCWEGALGNSAASSFTNLTPINYTADGSPAIVGTNLCQIFSFIGPVVQDLVAGVTVDLVSFNNIDANGCSADFFIDLNPPNPPIANGTASFINFFADEFDAAASTDISASGGSSAALTFQSGAAAPYGDFVSGDLYDFETDAGIQASNVINVGADIQYDSGTEVTLEPGFIATMGSIFRAFIDGCGGE